ncbi:hypothetical protein H4R99_002586 [Coemansia sp. RSA 1722]|nr:hypothetical protein LPJ57_002967 [Coemansia sp. RSA 486]KAJ2235298.1 hypothetical protein IWW45_002713 [Coemansia sp. RSA 485]KAJ2602756.1 hypothetical protein H4R99_002586 [Coemansia sp. RSA 1722]
MSEQHSSDRITQRHKSPSSPQRASAPSWMLPGDEEAGRSSSDAPSRTKRAQVKNACVNCQRACKKCDSGRPCQRCVKYNLQESCVDSKRKPRKKGIKRGPYKKRRKNNEESLDAESHHQQPTALVTSGVAEPPLHASLARTLSGSRVRGSRGARTSERTRPRGLLGPGMVPILQSDPPHGDPDSDELSSNSDTPLVATQQVQPLQSHYPPRLSLHTASSAPLPTHLLPETPTMGLTAAFGTLSTPSRPTNPLPASSDPPLSAARYPRRPDTSLPFSLNSGTIRLPPITSLVGNPPSSSSLSMLTDIALSATRRPATSAVRSPATQPQSRHRSSFTSTNPPYLSIPSLPNRPDAEQPREDTEQQSALLQPPEDAHSRHSTTTGSEDLSSNNGDDYDDSLHLDLNMDSSINKLSRKLQNTYLDQDSSSEL